MSDYISPAEQADWAADLLNSIGDVTSSNASAVNWIRNNLGELNYRLSTSFSITESGNISPVFNGIQSGIYNELFICYWLRKKSRTTIGSMDFDWTEMEGEDQGKIKKVSYLEKAKAYQKMALDCDDHLKELVKTYRGGDFAYPRQITFNGRHSSPKDIGCDCFDWSECNPINNC